MPTLLARFSLFAVMLPPFAPALVSQEPQADIVVDLQPTTASDRGIGWSPKAAKVALTRSGEQLTGSFRLGPGDAPAIAVALRKSEASSHFDRLAVDGDRNGRFDENEILTTSPTERRGKIWSSFSCSVDVPVTAPDQQPRVLAYPLALWFVADPNEPDAAPTLRWTRRGWMEGSARSGDDTIVVTVAETVMDGIYDRRDRWAIGATAEQARDRNAFRDLDDHNWRGEGAWRVTSIHPSGLQVTVRAFDPGVTRAAELAERDRYAADKRAPRAATPLAFANDFEAAAATAKADGKRLFVDFETTWCGPCKIMDQLVYSARAVVEAASGTVAVKVDGDERKDLKERFSVEAYPTLILIDADGRELRRAVGYQSVAQMRAFLGR